MQRPSRLASSFVVAASLLAVAVRPPIGWAQKPPPPNPQAPNLALPFPLGIQRGTSLDLQLTGGNLVDPTEVLPGFPCKAIIPKEGKNGADNAKLTVRLEVPKDAPVGAFPLRLATRRGMSNLRLFCVDDLPQILEAGKNLSREEAQEVPVPCVVAGRTDGEKSDWFRIQTKPGQRLSFEVLGRRLGTAIDPQISLYDAASGRELAHANDSPGCQTDCRLSFLFEKGGPVLVEIRDVLYRGGADYAYRLRIGDFPLATTALPMSIRRGTKALVGFAGPWTEGVQPVELVGDKGALANAVWATPRGPSGLAGWPVPVALSEVEEIVEAEPNDQLGKGMRVKMPIGITGRFQTNADTDLYLFPAKKGQKVLIEAKTLELGSPSLVHLVVRNAKGAELAKSNPQAAPPADQRIEFTPPEDGDFAVEAQHLNYAGGPNEVYRLSIAPVTPSFEVSLGLDRFDLAPGSFAALPLVIARKGYDGPIDIEAVGSPMLTGKTRIDPGQKAGVLVLRSEEGTPMGGHAVVLRARARIGDRDVVELATVADPVGDSLGKLPFPPLPYLNQIALAVKEKAPFRLLAQLSPAETIPGKGVQVTVKVERMAGFADAVALEPIFGLPPNVPAPKVGPLAKDKNEWKFTLDVNGKVPQGSYQLLLTGKGGPKGKEALASAAPLDLTVGPPFVLKVEPSEVVLAPGAKVKVKLTAQRKAGYDGPIALEIRKLPANVSAPKVTLDAKKDVIEVEISAAANAPPAEIRNVDVLGTATALNNLQNASPNFTVMVSKK